MKGRRLLAMLCAIMIFIMNFSGIPALAAFAEAEQTPPATEARAAEADKAEEEAQKAEEEAQKAEEAKKAEEEARKAEEAKKAEEEARKAEEAKKAEEEAQKAEEAKKAEEEAQKAEEAKKAEEEAQKAEEVKKAEEEAKKAEEEAAKDDGEKPAEPKTEPTEAPAEEQPEAEPTEAPAEEQPEAEPTEAPAEEQPEAEPTEVPAEEQPEAEPTEAPAEEQPTEAPTAEPTEEPKEPLTLTNLSASASEVFQGEAVHFTFDATGAERVDYVVYNGDKRVGGDAVEGTSFTWTPETDGYYTIAVIAAQGGDSVMASVAVNVRPDYSKVKVTFTAKDEDGKTIDGYKERDFDRDDWKLYEKAPVDIDGYVYTGATLKVEKVEKKIVRLRYEAADRVWIYTEEYVEDDEVKYADTPVTGDADFVLSFEKETVDARVTFTAVDAEGNVIGGLENIKLKKGDYALAEAAPVAVEGYIYQGATLDGAPVTRVWYADDAWNATVESGDIAITGEAALRLTFARDLSAVVVTFTAIDAEGNGVGGLVDAVLGKGDYDLSADGPVPVNSEKSYKYVNTTLNDAVVTALSYSDEAMAWIATVDGEAVTLTADTALTVRYEEQFENWVYRYSDGNIFATVTLSDAKSVPDDAKLVVTPITGGGSYDAYMAALNNSTEQEYTGDNTLLYDFAFMVRELDPETGAPTGRTVEYRPEPNSMRVSVTFRRNQISDGLSAEAPADVAVHHMPLKDSVLEDVDATVKASVSVSDIQAVETMSPTVRLSGSTDSVTFHTDSFSVFAFTVDFHYGVDYSIPGMSQILLSELIEKLNIMNGDALLDVKDVATVEFSDENLVSVQQVSGVITYNGVENVDVGEKDFLLTSKAPFTTDETLTITLLDGTVIVVGVTDAIPTSTDLQQFLKNISITGASLDDDGNYTVEKGKAYGVTLQFKENADLQFDDRGTLTYQLPKGITIPEAVSKTIYIKISTENGVASAPATLSVDTSGKVTVKFDESDPNFPYLASATNVGFNVSINAKFEENIAKETWNMGFTKDIKVGEPYSDAFAEKSATFDEATGTYTYTIKVRATGTPTNVHVKDVISGTALNFGNDVTVVSNKKSSSVSFNIASMSDGQKGFDYTFPSMEDGEEITITYTASLDSNALSGKTSITADMTRNTVTVQKDGGEPHNAEYSHTLNLKQPDKHDGVESGEDDEGNKLITWTIDYNSMALSSAGGDTIKDAITASSQEFMKYYGNVTVRAYSKGSDVVAWTETFTPGDDYNWSYTIPAEHTMPYRYVFEYKTVVDKKKLNEAGTVQLHNEAEGPENSKDTGKIDLAGSSKASITKAVESSSTTEVTWVSKITVPEDGLDSAVVTDTLPNMYCSNIGLEGNYTLYDAYKEGSLQIEGLLEGEYAGDPEVSADKVVIRFYKDAAKTQEGLLGVTGGHTITIRLTTLVNQDWLEKGYDYPGDYRSEHTNKISIGSSNAQDKATFIREALDKFGTDMGNGTYKYSVYVSNLHEQRLILEDTFDTNLLEVDTSRSEGDYNCEFFYITGGDSVGGVYPGQNVSRKVNYSETGTGVRIVADSIPMKSNGEYYPVYMITYFLKLRDGVDLEDLAAQNGGTYELTNTAKWGNHEDDFSFETKYEPLTKELVTKAGSDNRKVQYKITFNPKKARLNGGQTMKMTDTLSANISLDYTTVSIKTEPSTNKVTYSIQGDDRNQTIATYNVPDETSVVITYDAMVVGNGEQKYTNTVEVNGETETVTETAYINIDGEGSGATALLKISKVDGYDASKKLAGVKFRLYPTDPAVSLNKADEPFLGEKIVETDADGVLTISSTPGSQNYTYIVFGKEYNLEEVEPRPGYANLADVYKFTLVDDITQVDYSKGVYKYFYNDSFQIKNWPLEGLIIEKKVQSKDEQDLNRKFRFKITLEDGNASDSAYDYDPENNPNGLRHASEVTGTYNKVEFNAGVAYVELKNGQQVSITGLPVPNGTRYTVAEVDEAGETLTAESGYTTTVTTTVEGQAAGTPVSTYDTTGTISHDGYTRLTFTNKKPSGNLALTKTVADYPNTEEIPDVTFTVTPPNGVELPQTTFTLKDDFELNDGKYVLKATSAEKLQGIPVGEYKVAETASLTGYQITAKYKLNVGEVTSYGTPIDVQVTQDGNATVDFTNTYAPRSGDLVVKKVVTGNAKPADAATFYFKVTLTGSEAQMSIVNKAEGFETDDAQKKVKFENGSAIVTVTGDSSLTIKGLPAGLSYEVEEVADNQGNPLEKGTDGKYTVAGYITAEKTATGTIMSGTEAIAAITNEKNTYADLVIEKIIEGNNAKATDEFTFIVKLTQEDGTTPITGDFDAVKTSGGSKTNTTVSFKSNGEATVYLKGGESMRILKLPNGAKYTVTETVTNGYTTGVVSTHPGETEQTQSAATQVGPVAIVGGEDKEYKEAFTNTKDSYGSITLAKNVTGNGAKPSDTFTLKVTFPADTVGITVGEGSAARHGVEFTQAAADADFEAAVTVKADGTPVTIKNLPHGASYTVSEENAGEGNPVSFNVGGTIVYARTYTGTVDSEKTPIITVNNKVDKFGGLSVEKKLNSTVEADSTREFKVDVYLYPVVDATKLTVVDKDGQKIEGISYTTVDAPAAMTSAAGKKVSMATLTLKGGDKSTIRGLDVNSIYYIEEQREDLADYATTYTGQSGTIGEYSDTASFTPATGNQAIVQNDHLTGDLNVQKVVESNLPAVEIKKFPIKITLKNADGTPVSGNYGGVVFGVDGKNTTSIELGPNEIKSITNLPAGTLYTVEETLTGEDRQQYVVTYSGDVTKDENDKWGGTIKEGAKKSVTVTNTRNAYGAIKIEKKVAGNDPNKKSWFAVKVTLNDKTFNDTVKAKIGDHVFDLPFVNGEIKPAAEDAQWVQPADKKVVVAAGFIAITKDKPLFIYGLPANATYTVEEADYLETYEGRTIVYGDGTAGEGTIAVQVYNNDRNDVAKYTAELTGAAVATVTNTRDRFGKLVLIKLLAGNDISASDEFTFKIKLTKEDGTPISGEFSGYTFNANGECEVTLTGATGVAESDLQAHEPADNGGNMLVIEGLPLRAKFEVEELNNNKGYTIQFSDLLFRVKEDNPTALEEELRKKYNDEKVSKRTSMGASETVSGDIDVDQRVVVFCNERNTYGKLEVAKIVNALTGAEVPKGDANKKYKFTVKLTDAEGKPVKGQQMVEVTGAVEGTTPDASGKKYLNFSDDGEATFELADQATLTLVKLPNATNYVVTETDYSGDGYKTTVVAQGSTVSEADREVTGTIVGTINGDTIKEATYTNTYGRTSVSGVKTWSDGGEPVDVTVQLWKKAGVEEGKVDEIVLKASEASTHNWTFSFTNLPIMDGDTRIEYEIRELDVPGYSKRVTQKEDGSWEIVNTKIEEPTFEKKVKDTNDTTGETSDWQDSADYDIGDAVPFKLTATLANNVTDYTEYRVTLHDSLEAGLTLNSDMEVKVVGADGKVDTSYTRSEAGKAAGDTFAVTLTWGDGKNRIADANLNGATVEVLFTATLNDKARIGSQGNLNTGRLTYSDNPEVAHSTKDTNPDSVIVFTYQVDVNKLDEDGADLTGAAFKLEKKLADNTTKVIEKDITLSTDTTFSFKGLDDGTYILSETKAPTGYRLIAPFTFTVTAGHNPVWESGDRATVLEFLATDPKNGGDKATGVIRLNVDERDGLITGDVIDKEAEEPTFEKKVIDINDTTGKTEGPQDSADYDIGDAVPFVLTAKLADNVTDYEAYSIIFHDTLEDGKFGEAKDIKVTMGEEDLTSKLMDGDLAEGESFAKKLTWSKDEFSEALNGATVVLTFNAELLPEANIGAEGNVNKAHLEYSNTPGVDDEGKPIEDTDTTPEDAVIVFTYKVEIDKVDEDGKTPLTGAEFKLEKLDASGNVLSEDKWAPIEAAVNGNTFTFKGLDDGTYRLTETKVPAAGYKFMEPVTFTVTAGHTEWDVTSEGSKEANLNGRSSVLKTLTGEKASGEITFETADTPVADPIVASVKNTPATPPKFEKKVMDVNDSDGVKSDWQDSADYDIGDAVPFQLTAKLADNVTDYKTYRITFSDTMEQGLTFNADSVKVTVNGTETDAWKLTRNEEHAFYLMMEWKGTGKETIADKTLNSAVVVVTFTATLNKDAVIGRTGNVNKGKLHYSNNPNVEDDGEPGTPDYPDTPENPSSTPEDAVIVFTYKVDVNKVDEDGEPLPGAEFKLEKVLADGKLDLVENLIVTNEKTFSFTGLDDGDYILTETKAPDGYKRSEPIRFTVEADHQDDKEYDGITSPLIKLNGNVVDGTIELTADKELTTLTGDVENAPPTPPTFEKKVQDINDTTGNKSGWIDSADYDIGDAVPFQLTAKLADNVTDYKTYRITFSDTMEQGLTFNADSVKVTVNGTETDAWKLTRNEEHAFYLMMEWKSTGKETIDDKTLNSAVVVVTFTAELNKDAVIGRTGNVNRGKLYYSNNPNVDDDGTPGTPDYPDTPENPSSTPEDAVIVFTYQVDVNKVDEKGEALAGAAFTLTKVDAEKGNVVVGTYKADGKASTFSFKGLDDSDYILTETTVPEGYKAIDPIRFTVKAIHSDTWDGTEATRKAVLSALTGDAVSGAIELKSDAELSTLTGSVENTPSTPPTLEKKIQDINDSTGSRSGWQDSADYDIGDHVPFRLTATLADNVTDYKTYRITFSDTMEQGLTFDGITGVTVGGVPTTSYKLTRNEPHGFDLMLEWKGGNGGRITQNLNGKAVVVTYTATLNSDAVLGKTGNVNKAKLHYSNNPNVEDDGTPGTPDYPDTPDNPSSTPEDAVIAFTYQVSVDKVDEKGAALTGAEFKLEKVLSGGTRKVIATVKSQSGDSFSFKGLDDGNYILTETKAPSGYKAISPIAFTVKGTHLATWDGSEATRTQVLTDLTGDVTSGTLTLAKDAELATLSGDVVNERETGSLKVTKTVSGANASANTQSFHFTVKLSDKTISGKYGDMTFTKGEASFNLKHGESKTATGLPANVTYAVTEDKYDGYTTTSTGASGVISAGTTHEAAFTNTPVTTTPTPTATPSPRPGGGGGTPGPTPVPRIDIEGTKVWNDQGNAHKVRPGSIELTLLADGVPVDAEPVWVSKSGNNWSYRFENLPQYDEDDDLISYTVQERPVQYYTTAISGMVITNTLEERPPEKYIDLAGQKTWQDNDNAEGKRPTSITVHLLRDGEIISTLNVTAGTDWKYEFKNLPADDGYGHVYTYTIDEETVPGYFKRVDGMNLINGLLPGGSVPNVPDEPEEIPERGGTPAPNFEDLGEEELEDLFDLFGYGTPLYGMLGTGDELPVYPFVFGGIGLLAVALYMALRKRGKA